MQQIDNELDLVQQQLSQANHKLDEKDKALSNVSRRAAAIFTLLLFTFFFVSFLFSLVGYIVIVGRGGGSQSSEEDATA